MLYPTNRCCARFPHFSICFAQIGTSRALLSKSRCAVCVERKLFRNKFLTGFLSTQTFAYSRKKPPLSFDRDGYIRGSTLLELHLTIPLKQQITAVFPDRTTFNNFRFHPASSRTHFTFLLPETLSAHGVSSLRLLQCYSFRSSLFCIYYILCNPAFFVKVFKSIFLQIVVQS